MYNLYDLRDLMGGEATLKEASRVRKYLNGRLITDISDFEWEGMLVRSVREPIIFALNLISKSGYACESIPHLYPYNAHRSFGDLVSTFEIPVPKDALVSWFVRECDVDARDLDEDHAEESFHCMLAFWPALYKVFGKDGWSVVGPCCATRGMLRVSMVEDLMLDEISWTVTISATTTGVANTCQEAFLSALGHYLAEEGILSDGASLPEALQIWAGV